MSDKKYYWLRLKKDFFKRHDIQIIESMQNGKDYVLFYLKLLLESIDHSGELRFSDTIPYNESMLATITNTNIDIVKSAMKVLLDLKMIEILDDATIFVNETNKMIGSETYWAEQKRKSRTIGQCPIIVQPLSNVSNQEIEIEIEIDINKETSEKVFSEDSYQITASKNLFNKIQSINPKANAPNYQKWADHIDKLIRINKRTEKEIDDVIEFATGDTFWQCNILSTAKLRDKFDTLFLQMNKKPKQKESATKKNNFSDYSNQREYNYEEMERKALQNRLSEQRRTNNWECIQNQYSRRLNH